MQRRLRYFICWGIGLCVFISLVFLCLPDHHKHSILDVDNSESAGRDSYGRPIERWQLDTTTEYILKLPRAIKDPLVYFRNQVHHHNFEIQYVTTDTTHKLLLVNGKYPGPLIEVMEGDRVLVTVVNKSDEPTSLHFHGLHMNGTNYMDGTTGVTQCPIMPGKQFTYDFIADRAGTYWYHAHWSTQYMDGVIGPFVVHSYDDASDPTIEDEVVVLLSDLYDRSPSDLLIDYMEPWLGGHEPIPETAFVQGRKNPLIKLRPNQKYRLRIINASAYSSFQISIDEHILTLVEADSTPLEPHALTVIPIATGQRYSALLRTRSGQGTYAIRVSRQTGCYDAEDFDKVNHFVKQVTGVLEYTDKILSDHERHTFEHPVLVNPPSRPWKHNDIEQVLVESGLTPLDPERVPFPDKVIHLIVDVTRDDEGVSRGVINGTSYTRHETGNSLLGSGMVQQQTGARMRHSHYRPATIETEPFSFEFGSVVDFVLSNMDDGPHPFHMHGHQFWVVERGHHASQLSTISEHPLQRDTVWLGKDEWVRIRFVADNPGVWLFHCHNLWHALTGMELEVVVRGSEQFVPPREWYDLC